MWCLTYPKLRKSIIFIGAKFLAGFNTDYINLIVGNLRDRYKSGFPILKELVQNADDAGAKYLTFGYHEGHGENADHMLLKGPALWVLNDGGFKDTDKEAIRSFGVNAKAGDDGVIGKFGLGMKSVFHLCEGFFYLAHHEGKEHHDFLNPWHSEYSDSMHKAWEKVTERDRDCLRKVSIAQTEGIKGKSWFILWVPLRKYEHIPQQSAAIIERYPGEDKNAIDLDFFSDPMTKQRIGALLPLLRNLYKIRFAGMKDRPTYTVELESRSDDKRLDHKTENLQIHGLINDNENTSKPLYFLARQRVQNEEIEPFKTLRNSEGWPISNVITTDVITNKGKREFKRDKATAEAAVMFSHGDGRNGSLELQWAVFLPVDEQQFSYKCKIDNSSREYKVVLHGQFFVDSGRRGILNMDSLSEPYDVSSEEGSGELILKQWNQALAQELTLPKLLPTLNEYVNSFKLKDDEITILSKAFRYCVNDNGKFFVDTFKNYICKRFAWIRQFTKNGAEWQLITAQTPILYLPAPPKTEPERPWTILGGLDKLTENFAFADKEAPNIMLGHEDWSEDILLIALRNVPVNLLKSKSNLDYFGSFLDMEASRYVQNVPVQERLVEILQECLSVTSLQEVRNHRESFKKVVSILSEKFFFGVGTKEGSTRFANERLYKELLKANTKALLLPADLCPDNKKSKPQSEDLNIWLNVLGNSEFASVKERLVLADNILDNTTEIDRPSLLRRNQELKVMRVLDVLNGAENAVSLRELEEAYQQDFLFKQTSAIERLVKVKKLAEALPESKVFIVHSRVREDCEKLFDMKLLDSLSSADVLQSVGSAKTPPKLGSIAHRADLLNLVDESSLKTNNFDVLRGVRYLLHNSPAHYSDTSTVLLKEAVGEKTPWVKLLKMIDESPWQILDKRLCGSINDNCSEILNIRIAKGETVLPRLIHSDKFDKIVASDFRGEEISQILNEVHNHYYETDKTVWRKLPLHEDVNGDFGNILGEAFLSEGSHVNLPDGLDADIRFIKPCKAHSDAQKAYLKDWNEETAASIILKAEKPVRYWRELMDLLKDNPELIKSELWGGSDWLPLQSRGAISLKRLISLETLEKEIKDLSEQCGYKYAQAIDLSRDIQEHSAYETLLREISSKEKALPILAQLMSTANYSIGLCAKESFHKLEEEHFDALIGLLPAWGILAKARKEVSLEDIKIQLVPEICKPLSSDSCLSILRQIPNLDENVQEISLEIYLKEWVDNTNSQEIRKKLSSIRLLNKEKEWKQTSQLTAGVHELTDEFVLEEKLTEILKAIITIEDFEIQDEQEDVGNSSQSLVNDLESLFNPFFDSSSRSAAGAVIGLFGENLAPLATKWLEPLAYDDYLDKIGWKIPGREGGRYDRRGKWMSGKTLREALSTLDINLKLVSGESVVVRSIVNTPFEARMISTEEVNNLFIKVDGWYKDSCTVHLRDLGQSFATKEVEKQKRILMLTAETILRELYGQENSDLSELFEFTGQTDQISLSVARSLILDSLPFLLSQIPGVTQDARLMLVRKKYDDARNNHASAKAADNENNIKKTQKELEEALDGLAKLVEEDLGVQKTLLNGIKERVEQNQYDVSSIPFEIFQNADDAVTELQLLQIADGRTEFSDASIGNFVLSANKDTLRFVHWGRPINYTGIKNTNASYRNDLERMLMLGGSDKTSSNGNVTGKFGLGFKSTLLASDTPRVWSRDLRFEVIAGCLPKKWELANEVELFKQEIEAAIMSPKVSGISSTIIDLPLDDDLNGKKITERFTALAGLLTVFAKKIRHIRVNNKIYRWEPEYVLPFGTSTIETGSILLPSKDGLLRENIVVIRAEYGVVAFLIGSKGIKGFNKKGAEIPNVWVTAPTRGTTAHGFILNADFQIDTGRTKLANSGPSRTANELLVDKLADEVAQIMIELYGETETNWRNIAEQLGLPSISSTNFWLSFWDALLGEKSHDFDDAERELLERFACRVMRIVVRTIKYIPNGLQGDLVCLIPFDELCLELPPNLSIELLSILSSWETFTNKYPRQGWCSSKVATWLKRSQLISGCEEALDCNSLTLGHIINNLSNNHEVKPEDVDSLVKIIEAWPKGDRLLELWINDFKYIYGSQLRLLSIEGSWKRATELILDANENNGDKHLLRFAPDKVKVHSSYDSESNFFKKLASYLPEFEHNCDDIVEWCLAASEKDSQKACITWLANYWYFRCPEILSMRFLGQYSDDKDCWLFNLTENSPLLNELQQERKLWLLNSLEFISNQSNEEHDYFFNPYSELNLQSIYDWWLDDGKEKYLSDFERKVFPANFDREALKYDESLNRTAWMTLFSLGLFRRYGRVKDEQHRGFIEFLDSNNWWQIICDSIPDTLDGKGAWMDILLEYGEMQEAQPLFEQWMDSFPRLYRVARWLNTYVELFQSIDMRSAEEIHHLLSPSIDPTLQGSGIEAPTLSGMLRQGQYLVIRELLRTGVIKSEIARKFAYAPRQNVKELVFGYDDNQTSEEIHEQLVTELGEEQACFDGDYDIPLQVIAMNEGARRALRSWMSKNEK